MESIISTYALVSAIGLGLLIGVVRERSHTDSTQIVAGVRTHVMVALAGALGAALGPLVLVAVLLLLGALTVVSYVKTGSSDPGLTGEVAVPVTALLAALAHSHPGLAAGLAVVVAGVLYAKRPLHELALKQVSEQELQDGLLLAGAALVVLPLLPTEPVDPWGVLVPSRLWRMVVLILAVGMAGHIALRTAGVRWGLPLAGFLAGFASSTAAVAGFGQRAREEPTHVASAAAGALFANLGSMSLFAAVVGTASPDLLRLMAVPLLVAGTLLLAVSLLMVVRQEALSSLPEGGDGRAFRISHALMLAGLMGVLLLVSAALQRQFGSAAAMAAAGAVALVEVHAAVASLGQLAMEGQVSLGAAAWGMVLLTFVAAAAKTTLAFAGGGAAYGWRILFGLTLIPAGMGVTLALQSIT